MGVCKDAASGKGPEILTRFKSPPDIHGAGLLVTLQIMSCSSVHQVDPIRLDPNLASVPSGKEIN